MTWRARYTPIIAKVVAEHGDKPGLRQALREAFPDGPRQYHPYKIWLDEIRVQLGQKPIKARKGEAVKSKGTPAAGRLWCDND